MALLPPEFMRSVVAIGTKVDETSGTHWIGTGFMYRQDRHGPNGTSNLFLVTNGHVVEDDDEIILKMNRESGLPPVEFSVSLREDPEFLTYHPGDVDLVVLPLPSESLTKEMVESYPISETESLTLDKAKEAEVAEGDGIFTIGFPLGLVGYEEQNFPIVKQGCIARIQDWLSGGSASILIDANIFPGNSGGPVFLQPTPVAVEGTTTNPVPYLIGMVSGYIPYQDGAYSAQTGRLRVVFEENSGIVEVVPCDAIMRTIELAMRKL